MRIVFTVQSQVSILMNVYGDQITTIKKIVHIILILIIKITGA